jgi:hypothetical protein
MTLKRGHKDDNRELHSQPMPAPSFLSLPDLTHANIGSFLRDDDDDENNSCLRVAEVSRELFVFY